MITRKLGRTGIVVTQLSYGAMEIRGPKTWNGPDVTEQQAETILNAVLDAGINFIDTSYDYGDSEQRIGKYIGSRRDEYFLATKCGCDPEDLGDRIQTDHTWTRENLMRNISGSLERMQTDHVDVLQLHNPTVEDVQIGDLVAVLKDIQSQKMARLIGISTTLPELPRFVEMGAFDTFQIPYSCLEPRHHEAVTMTGEAGAGVIIRGGVARGGPAKPRAGKDRRYIWEEARLDEMSAEQGIEPAELILRYTLSHPHCHTTIVGTMAPDHLAANVAAADKGPLAADVYDEVTRRVSAVSG